MGTVATDQYFKMVKLLTATVSALALGSVTSFTREEVGGLSGWATPYVKIKKSEGWGACRDHCQRYPQCDIWTYRGDKKRMWETNTGKDGKCYLKGRHQEKKNRKTKEDRICGIRDYSSAQGGEYWAILHNIDCKGGDLKIHTSDHSDNPVREWWERGYGK